MIEPNKKRTLIYVQIVHPSSVLSVQTNGYIEKVYSRMLEELYLPFKQLNVKRIYHDGFVDKVGREYGALGWEAESFCKEHFPSLYTLAEKLGAQLEKTEDFWPNFFHKHLMNNHFFEKRLFKVRDKRVAKNVDKTLRSAEVGALFMGAAHRVPCYLTKYRDIETSLASLHFGKQKINQVTLALFLLYPFATDNLTRELNLESALKMIDERPELKINEFYSASQLQHQIPLFRII